jgi:cytochrome P450
MYINLLGQDLVIISSYHIAVSLLREKPLYGGRVRPYFLAEMVGWRHVPNFVSAGPAHKRARQLFAREFGSDSALSRFNDIINTHCTEFIRQILNNPVHDHLLRHIRA